MVGRAMVEAALRYAAMGWPVFPCAPRSKVPLFANPHPRHGVQRYRCRGYRDCGRLGHGVLDATTDPDLITGVQPDRRGEVTDDLVAAAARPDKVSAQCQEKDQQHCQRQPQPAATFP